MKNHSGFSLLEMLLVAALIGLVILAATQLLFPVINFFQRGRAQQKATLEARTCIETIERVLSNGRASTVVISTPPTTPAMPSGQIQFLGVDTSTYTISWSTSPMNTVHLQKTSAAGVTNDTVLATHVTQLSFCWNPNDPGILNVTLQMTVPFDSSGSPGSFLTIYLPGQTLRMVTS